VTKFLDIFDPIVKGDFGLTDEAIYNSMQRGGQFIPVYGAYQEHDKPIRFIPENGRSLSSGQTASFKSCGTYMWHIHTPHK
jgi:hypothetical protein